MYRSEPRRVLSLTPTSLSRDSRTLKAAMTYARLGAKSRIIEDIASAISWRDWPIEVVAVRRPDSPRLRQIGRRGLRDRHGGSRAFLVFAAYLAYYLVNYCLRPLPHMRRAALYHLHSYEYFPLVRLWTRLFGGQYVYDAHDFYADLDPRVDLLPVQRQWIRPFQRWIEQRCIKGAAAVLTVNDGIAGLIEARYGRRPDVVRNCHDFRLDRAPPHSLREAIGLGSEEFIVVSVGQYKPGLAAEEALEALALLPERVHLAFVGGGYDDVTPAVARLGLAGRVHAPGSVPPYEIVPFIASADAALIHYHTYTSNYENALPNGFFQAMAAGLPLVHSPLPQISRILAACGAGIAVDPKSPAAIAAAIRRLADDREERLRQAEAIRRLRESLSFEAEETVLIDILRRVVPLATPA